MNHAIDLAVAVTLCQACGYLRSFHQMALPVNGSTHLIPAYYSFCRPRKDERLSWPSWLTCSGWFTHISGHPSAAGRAQDRESSPARDRRSATVLRHQPGGKKMWIDCCTPCRRSAANCSSVALTASVRSGTDSCLAYVGYKRN